MRISDWSSDVCSSDLEVLDEADVLCEDDGLVRRFAVGEAGQSLEVRDLARFEVHDRLKRKVEAVARDYRLEGGDAVLRFHHLLVEGNGEAGDAEIGAAPARHLVDGIDQRLGGLLAGQRSEEHTSELQSLMRISYAVFCLKK